AEEIALPNLAALLLHGAHEFVIANQHPVAAVQAFQINQYTAALYAGRGKVFNTQAPSGRRFTVAFTWPHDVDASPEAVVVGALSDPIAVDIEHLAHVAQRIPLGRVLSEQRHRVVRDDIAETGAGIGKAIVIVVAVAAPVGKKPWLAPMLKQ